MAITHTCGCAAHFVGNRAMDSPLVSETGVMKTTAALLLLMIGLLVAGQNMPDHSGEKSAADDAIAQQRLDDHVAAVSKTICGENGVLKPTDAEGSFVCVTKRGFVTNTKGIL